MSVETLTPPLTYNESEAKHEDRKEESEAHYDESEQAEFEAINKFMDKMEETENVITIDVPLLTPEDIDELRRDIFCFVDGEEFKNDNCLLSEFRAEYPEHREPIETQREAIQFIKHGYPDRIVLTEALEEEPETKEEKQEEPKEDKKDEKTEEADEETDEEEYDYEKKLIEELRKLKKSANKNERIKLLKEFIKKHMMALRPDEVKAFISVNLEAFAIGNDGKKILRDYYAAEKKESSKHKAANDLNIHPKYNGMYTVTVTKNDDLTNVIPHTDKIAKMILGKKHTVTYKDQIYVYEAGYYQVVTELVEFEVVQILADICKGANSNKVVQYKNSAMEYIRNGCVETEYPFNTAKNAINVSNGIVLLDTENYDISLIPYDPVKYMFNYVLPVKYDKSAPTEPMYNELAKYVDEPEVLTQMMAQALLQVLGYGPYKTFYVLQGMRDTGKSTFLEWIEATIGTKSICSVGLNELSVGVDKFSTSSLEGKILNLHDDMGYFKMDDVGTIKRLVGKYVHEIQKKGIQP